MEEDGVDARAFLEKRIADGLGPSPRIHLDRSEIRGMATGLVAAGALRPEEAEQLLLDLDETLKAAGLLKVMQAKLPSGGGGGGARKGLERPEWRQAIDDPPLPVLRHVVSLAGRTVTVGETTSDLVSLEVWSTFLTLHTAQVGGDRQWLRHGFGPDVRWHGWDDEGTKYVGAGGVGSGLPPVQFKTYRFEPGPPTRSTVFTLVVDHPGGRVTTRIPLPRTKVRRSGGWPFSFRRP
jgi:hypothetical protein